MTVLSYFNAENGQISLQSLHACLYRVSNQTCVSARHDLYYVLLTRTCKLFDVTRCDSVVTAPQTASAKIPEIRSREWIRGAHIAKMVAW